MHDLIDLSHIIGICWKHIRKHLIIKLCLSLKFRVETALTYRNFQISFLSAVCIQ